MKHLFLALSIGGPAGLVASPLLAQTPPAARLAPGLRPHATPAVRVQVHDAAAFRQWAAGALPGARVAPGAGAVLEITRLTTSQFNQLAVASQVAFIDLPNRPAHDERLLNSADLTVNSLRAVQRRYPALRGQGLAVSVKENPLDYTDLDFRGRLLNTPAGTVTESAHASTMATLIAGAGNSGPNGEGAAPRAGIASASYANLLPDANSDLTRLGVSVQNHSYGTGIENYYGLEAQGYDRQARELPTLLHVFSSGNSGISASTDGSYKGLAGWANLTGQFKMSKNSLSVGATDALGQVAALSSRGPAHDGRVKPELVAYGDAGSSDASALVSGAALLVQQAYRDGPGAGALPPAALVKAALLNGADDVGRPAVDFTAGFGQLNALEAVRTVLEGRTRAGSVGQGQEQTFALVVPPGTAQLKVTLTWADPEAVANASRALINDLDLDVVGPGGTRLLPWVLSAYPHPDSLALPARRRPDHLNNAEQVTLAAPPAGTYQLRVRGYAVSTGPQAFSIAYTVAAPGLEWLVPAAIRNVRPGQPARLRWRWPGAPASGRLEYRPVGAATWRLLANNFDVSQQTSLWSAPDTTTLAQLRCVVGSQAYLSDTFALARPPSVRVGYACAEESLLSWPATPGAVGYQVYTLGATAPTLFRQVADTLLLLNAAESARQYFAVAPVLAGQVAERSPTASLSGTGLSCYIQYFLPRQPLADTAQLVLALGSLYRLRTVQLQRLGTAGFQTIQTLSPPTRVTTLFTDRAATPGLNQYRVLGQDAAGRVFYSDTVAVQLVRPGELLVFPIPAVAGQDVQVAGAPGVSLRIDLYDALGRCVLSTTVTGALNPVPTAGLHPGVYLLRATPAGGATLTRRLVLLE